MTTCSTPAAFSWWHAPEALVEQFAAVHRVLGQEQARLLRLAAAMAGRLPEHQREFVADDLALVMNVHPRTAQTFVHTAVTAVRLPGLLDALAGGELTERHVHAVVDELVRWAPDDATEQAAVWQLVCDRVRARLRLGDRWPTPGELRRRVRAAALLRDLTAAEKARRSVADKRGVHCYQSAVGEGTVSLTGPEAQVVAVAEAVRARAEAYGRLPGDTRTLQQRMFDAAYDLLTVDAAGGTSAVPALDVDGLPVTISVRGIEIQVLVPYSVTLGGDLELAEIPGFGPLLPEAARELLAQAEAVRQIAVDATAGEVLAVEDRQPVPHRHAGAAEATPEAEPEPKDEAAATPVIPSASSGTRPVAGGQRATTSGDRRPDVDVDPLVTSIIEGMLDRPLQHLGPLGTDTYRANARLLRAIRARDRTCCFPGCTTPAAWTDADHRDPWPRGATSTENLHCLCRRHHRAKHAYFTAEVDIHHNTVWTTPDGRHYRRPPPHY